VRHARSRGACADVSARSTLPAIALHALLAAGAIATLAPLAWMVSASLMPAGEANNAPPPLLPSKATLEHYVTLLTQLDLARNLFNSAFVSVTTTLLSLLLNSMAGYAFAKLRFRGREAVFQFLVAALVIPAQVGMLPLFLLLKAMGLVNTFAAVMLVGLAPIYAIFMVRQYALSIPDELLDAARMDGASEFHIYRTIVLPVIKPILVTLAAFTFLTMWNDFMWPLIVLNDSDLYTLPVALASLSREHVQDNELMMAGSVVTVLPVLVLFLLLQRHYIQGLLLGGVKG
jgi:multiple sugar transport system permease protein